MTSSNRAIAAKPEAEPATSQIERQRTGIRAAISYASVHGHAQAALSGRDASPSRQPGEGVQRAGLTLD